MKPILFFLAVQTAFLAEQPPAKTSAPKVESENLTYNVNWPSGLSLGEARFSTQKTAAGYSLSFQVEVNIPGFGILDAFRSTAADGYCAVAFEKDISHGKRKSKEKIAFDSTRNVATRETIGGGKSELPTPPCARDPLSYLQHARQELAQGRIAAAQPVFYGAAYQVRMEYAGAQRIRVGDSPIEADRIVLHM